MKLIVNGESYSVSGNPSLAEPVLFRLSDTPPNDLGDTLTLIDNSDFILCEINVSDYKYWTTTDSLIMGTNFKNENPGPGPDPDPIPTYDEMAAAIKEGVDGV